LLSYNYSGTEAQSKVKNLGPEDQALAIPGGDLLRMKKMNPGRLWRRRRRVNIECGYRSCPPSRDILNALRSFVACPQRSRLRGGRVFDVSFLNTKLQGKAIYL